MEGSPLLHRRRRNLKKKIIVVTILFVLIFIAITLAIYFIFYKKKSSSLECDFIVVGSGIVLIVASLLSQAGYKVCLFEAGGKGQMQKREECNSSEREMCVRMCFKKENKTVCNREDVYSAYDIPGMWPLLSCDFRADEKCSFAYLWNINDSSLAKVFGGCLVHNNMVTAAPTKEEISSWNNTYWVPELMGKLIKKVLALIPAEPITYLDCFSQSILQAANATSLFEYKTDWTTMSDSRSTCIGQILANTHNGRRISPSIVYPLDKVQIFLHSEVTQVLFNGNKAMGVQVKRSDGSLESFYANQEVILGAGALNTPKLLINSGVGPKHLVEKRGAKLVMETPQYTVEDHPIANLVKRYGNFTFYHDTCPDPYGDITPLIQYMMTQEGRWTWTGLPIIGYINTDKGLVHFTVYINPLHEQKSILLGVAPAKPTTRRTLTLDENNNIVLSPKQITPEDLDAIIEGIRVIRELDSHMDHYGDFIRPNKTCIEDLECLKKSIPDWIVSDNHWASTTAIGTFLDNDGRIKGLRNIRVADMGVVPHVPQGPPQLTGMAIAQGIAELIIQEYQNKFFF